MSCALVTGVQTCALPSYARSIEFHDWLRREPRFCVQPTGRSGSDSGGVGGATYRRARAPLRAARENRAQGMPTRVVNTTRQVSIQAGSPRFAGLPVSSDARPAKMPK